ncbi:MAG: hypothetical protein CML44_02925 [Rhodobacteraceae bacterium]|nr:hypothetical protein [Paracoccaceae bacterium]
MKALIYTKENGDVSSIMDSEGIGYEGLLTRLPLNCTDIVETTVDAIPVNPVLVEGVYVAKGVDMVERAEALREEALAYQSSQQSQNELGILHGYSVADLDSKPKAKANIDWMTELFTLQKAKSLDVDNDTPFSSVGDKPHAFEEIYAEKWVL